MTLAYEEYRLLYTTTRWRKLRRVFLAEHPLCAMCQQEDKVCAAEELDHIVPHRGDLALFWNVQNLQALCRFHHRSVKAQMERSGRVRGCDANGEPLDPNHAWYRSDG